MSICWHEPKMFRPGKILYERPTALVIAFINKSHLFAIKAGHDLGQSWLQSERRVRIEIKLGLANRQSRTIGKTLILYAFSVNSFPTHRPALLQGGGH